jgi:hypothetical protein
MLNIRKRAVVGSAACRALGAGLVTLRGAVKRIALMLLSEFFLPRGVEPTPLLGFELLLFRLPAQHL